MPTRTKKKKKSKFVPSLPPPRIHQWPHVSLDHYDDEARGDEGARNLQFEIFPVAVQCGENSRIQTFEEGRRLGDTGVCMWDVATMSSGFGCNEDRCRCYIAFLEIGA